MQGNDQALLWGYNPGYIDVKVGIAFEEVKSDIGPKFKVSGEIFGDRFPANETYMTDGDGNKLFFGVSAVDNDAWYAPFKELLGTAGEKMSKYEFFVQFEKNDHFMGVSLSDGTWFTPI